MVRISRGGQKFVVLWKNRDTHVLIPAADYKEEQFEAFRAKHKVPHDKVFTKALRDKNYPRI